MLLHIHSLHNAFHATIDLLPSDQQAEYIPLLQKQYSSFSFFSSNPLPVLPFGEDDEDNQLMTDLRDYSEEEFRYRQFVNGRWSTYRQRGVIKYDSFGGNMTSCHLLPFLSNDLGIQTLILFFLRKIPIHSLLQISTGSTLQTICEADTLRSVGSGFNPFPTRPSSELNNPTLFDQVIQVNFGASSSNTSPQTDKSKTPNIRKDRRVRLTKLRNGPSTDDHPQITQPIPPLTEYKKSKLSHTPFKKVSSQEHVSKMEVKLPEEQKEPDQILHRTIRAATQSAQTGMQFNIENIYHSQSNTLPRRFQSPLSSSDHSSRPNILTSDSLLTVPLTEDYSVDASTALETAESSLVRSFDHSSVVKFVDVLETDSEILDDLEAHEEMKNEENESEKGEDDDRNDDGLDVQDEIQNDEQDADVFETDKIDEPDLIASPLLPDQESNLQQDQESALFHPDQTQPDEIHTAMEDSTCHLPTTIGVDPVSSEEDGKTNDQISTTGKKKSGVGTDSAEELPKTDLSIFTHSKDDDFSFHSESQNYSKDTDPQSKHNENTPGILTQLFPSNSSLTTATPTSPATPLHTKSQRASTTSSMFSLMPLHALSDLVAVSLFSSLFPLQETDHRDGIIRYATPASDALAPFMPLLFTTYEAKMASLSLHGKSPIQYSKLYNPPVLHKRFLDTPFFATLIFCLLIGIPVVVQATEDNKAQVVTIIGLMALFLPSPPAFISSAMFPLTTEQAYSIIPTVDLWRTEELTPSAFSHLRLCGLSKSADLDRLLSRHIAVWDYETDAILIPQIPLFVNAVQTRLKLRANAIAEVIGEQLPTNEQPPQPPSTPARTKDTKEKDRQIRPQRIVEETLTDILLSPPTRTTVPVATEFLHRILQRIQVLMNQSAIFARTMTSIALPSIQRVTRSPIRQTPTPRIVPLIPTIRKDMFRRPIHPSLRSVETIPPSPHVNTNTSSPLSPHSYHKNHKKADSKTSKNDQRKLRQERSSIAVDMKRVNTRRFALVVTPNTPIDRISLSPMNSTFLREQNTKRANTLSRLGVVNIHEQSVVINMINTLIESHHHNLKILSRSPFLFHPFTRLSNNLTQSSIWLNCSPPDQQSQGT
ncbi:hypothetical protein BLNAU_1871 [Blattamonas nauphoetae]|uniref:Uncharacterized protein n=1 Tax=Blattamonas nauphoetae TaxID=2049346 RepID=A0ABQ9YHU5_9EUKA|nr:hypothetical protein BLNAU_1871 [Blattamonas nauphoetae]